jgi:hypothetical protein
MKAKDRLPAGYEKLTEEEKTWIRPYPDTKGWSNKKLKWWLTRSIRGQRSFETMFYLLQRKNK